MKINQSKLLEMIFRDMDLTWGAYGLLCTLILTRDIGQVFSIEELEKISKESKEELQELLDELEENGWICQTDSKEQS